LKKLSFGAQPIEKISVSSNSDQWAMALDAAGHVWSWGEGDYGPWGHGERETCPTPCRIQELEDTRIIDISCGAFYGAAVSDTGTCYIWGDVGSDMSTSAKPVPLDTPTPVHFTAVACGSSHTLALGNEGTELWSWGENGCGELGRNQQIDSFEPGLVALDIPHRFVQVIAGEQWSAVRTENGEVWVCGGNEEGLGLGAALTQSDLFQRINSLHDVSHLDLALRHAIAVNGAGRIFCWGANECGQLGTDDENPRQAPVEVRVPSDMPCVAVSVGRDFTLSLHTAQSLAQLGFEQPVEKESVLHGCSPMDIAARSLLLREYATSVIHCHRLFPMHGDESLELKKQLWRIPYEDKVTELRGELGRIRTSHGPVITLRRLDKQTNLFQQACQQLVQKPAAMRAHRAWKVKFGGEGAEDAGGPYSESVSCMCSELQAGEVPIMRPTRTSHGESYEAIMPAPLHAGHSQSTRQLYRFLGMLMASSVISSQPLSLQLPSLFWKLLVGSPYIHPEDLKEVDAPFYDSHSYLLSLEEMALSEEDFADLPLERFLPVLNEDGELISLTHTTITAYVHAAYDQALSQWDEAVREIREGFMALIQSSVFLLFSAEQIELLVCGTQKIDWAQLREITRYGSLSATSDRAQWLWEILEELDDEQSVQFLRFVCGRSRLPPRVADLGMQMVVIGADASHKDSLPSASTCFFQLLLPRYSSKDTMREKLLYAIRHCNSIDTDFVPDD